MSGARYDNTYQGNGYIGSCDSLYGRDEDYFTGDVKDNYRKVMEASLDAFTHSKVAGWAFWCWKTENTVEWDFKELVKLDIIPQPFTGRYYYNQCGFDQW
ncbi:unnamed protein product [Ambrosiozyma monospora]|uniref:Unnamed protein product n=1 Tax=Ambrosiozyma monospora TaxID=43982 RepID=A0ACB5T5F0_AMBMO|nr:unnamed protein product [Ambrosiozyma monospora]